MKISTAFFVVITLWSQLSWITDASCYTAIYSFGDSLTDTGNLLASMISNVSKLASGSLPYGETYFRKPTGRFSDGRLIVDYIANASGLPLLDPYLGNRTSTFKCGVNFAVGRATALDLDFFSSKNITLVGTPFSLDTQIQWFLSQRPKFCATYRGKECNEHFANALFLMGEIGINDYTYAFFQQRSMKEVQTFVPLVVDKIINVLQTLITVGGARKILVQNNLPMGCSAAYLTQFATGLGEPLDKMGCMPRFNAFAQNGSNLLRARVAELQAQHSDVKFVFADCYNAALRVLQSPQSFGLQTNVLQVCCGAGGPYNFNISTPCGEGGAVSCANPQQHFNWDGIHLTDAAYGKIANLFLDGTFTSPPLNTLCSSFEPCTSGFEHPMLFFLLQGVLIIFVGVFILTP